MTPFAVPLRMFPGFPSVVAVARDAPIKKYGGIRLPLTRAGEAHTKSKKLPG
jgi:hypothetical protein